MMFFVPPRRRAVPRRPSPCASHAWLAASLLTAAWTAQAQSTADVRAALSVHDAVQAATARATSPAAAVATARAAREMAVAAAQRPDPVLRLSLDNVPVEGPDRFSTTRDFMTQRSISLMQTFTRADKLSARAQRFEREAEAAQAERRVRIAAVQRDTAIAWFERRAAEQRQAVLQRLRSEVRSQVEAAEAALRGARAMPADLIAARDALAQLEQALLDVDAEVANARRMLARWTGEPDHLPLAEAPALAQHALVGHDVSDRLGHHPDLLQLAAREAQAGAEAAAARAEREPDWSAELMFGQRGSRFANMVSVGVSLPLPWDRPQRQDRELAARLAQAEALRAEREELAREHLAQTESWIAAWRAGLARLALIDRDRAALAQQRVDAALAAYRGGQSPLSAVLDARRAALALQMERIDLELQTARLWTRLEFLIPAEPTAAAAHTALEGAAR
ncbi:TolC family protein [uncultured Piscinibacter sp.]|uniref:TolC family protein n=1 Tax=uncultured Piscinibacter sp. TaxID=1131835 RepID=UPI002619C6F3|nr:TolC family protein [uncultured Piscinibacter sp.]